MCASASDSLANDFQTHIGEWEQYRDEFTDEVLRHEGLAGLGAPPPCVTCSESGAVYRCLDCHFRHMLCQRCIVTAHGSEPLHSLQVTFSTILFARV
jgi:hypothetical protein